MERISQILDILSKIKSPSGKENQKGEYLQSAYKKYVDRIVIDNRGNVFFHKDALHSENSKNVMILAYIDTIISVS